MCKFSARLIFTFDLDLIDLEFEVNCQFDSHTFSAFWLRSSVVSVLLSLISETWDIFPNRLIRKISVAIWFSYVLDSFLYARLASRLWIIYKRDLSIAVPLRVAGIKTKLNIIHKPINQMKQLQSYCPVLLIYRSHYVGFAIGNW